MKTKSLFLFTAFSLLCFSNSFSQKNLTVISKVNYSPATLAGVWHYSKNGKEYALVGTSFGISIVDVTNKIVPVKLMQLPGVNSNWHEVKVWGDYAYAVSEGLDTTGALNGVQVINLSYLPDSAPNHFWKGDSIIAGRLKTAHSVTADAGYLYINGHNIDTLSLHRGVIIADLTNPWNPHFVGADTIRYCHDSYVRGDTMYTSDIQAGVFSIFKIANRAKPHLIATVQTPSRYNHNTWLSDNGKYLFTTDEKTGAPIGSFDISDINNIELVDVHYSLNMRPAEAHNVRVLNDFIINAGYGSQVTLVDAKYPDNLIEIGNHVTGNSLCWDADPYLPSEVILATDKMSGDLFIFQPTYTRACYLVGNVTDSITGSPIFNAFADIQTTYVKDSTNLSGDYKTGYPDSGFYAVHFSKAGYFPKTISNVHLQNGVQTVLNVQLAPDNTGISETETSASFTILQSPSHNIMTINLSKQMLAEHSGLQLKIMDASGKRIQTVDNIHTTELKISIAQFARGIYFVQLVTNEGTHPATKKVVLQ